MAAGIRRSTFSACCIGGGARTTSPTTRGRWRAYPPRRRGNMWRLGDARQQGDDGEPTAGDHARRLRRRNCRGRGARRYKLRRRARGRAALLRRRARLGAVALNGAAGLYGAERPAASSPTSLRSSGVVTFRFSARQGRPRRDRSACRRPVEGRAGARRGRRRTQPHLCRGVRQRSRLLLVLPVDAGLRSRSCARTIRGWCSSPIRSSSGSSSIRPASRALRLLLPRLSPLPRRPRLRSNETCSAAAVVPVDVR